jgi:hypothetical protein
MQELSASSVAWQPREKLATKLTSKGRLLSSKFERGPDDSVLAIFSDGTRDTVPGISFKAIDDHDAPKASPKSAAASKAMSKSVAKDRGAHAKQRAKATMGDEANLLHHLRSNHSFPDFRDTNNKIVKIQCSRQRRLLIIQLMHANKSMVQTAFNEATADEALADAHMKAMSVLLNWYIKDTNINTDKANLKKKRDALLAKFLPPVEDGM